MFGYVYPLESELKVKEQTLYKAAYCGLCRTIGARYGLSARMALNYDCTFLALFLQALTGVYTCIPARCGVRMRIRKIPVLESSGALEYSADVNVMLAGHQLEDAWQDDRSFAAFGENVLLRSAGKKAALMRSPLAVAVRSGLDALHAIERAKDPSPDAAACAFGELLSGVPLGFHGLEGTYSEQIRWMFFNLGRWIYLMDAWEDRAKDERRGSYNPFLLSGATPEDAAFQLYTSLTEMECAYDLIRFKGDTGLLDNIVHLGCREKTRALLAKMEGNGNESV